MSAAAPHLCTGRRGEQRVAAFFEAKGYRVLARNLRLAAGEADLVVAGAHGRGGLLVEVKTSRVGAALLPRIDARKAARLFAVAEQVASHFELDEVAVVVAAVQLDTASERIALHTVDPW